MQVESLKVFCDVARFRSYSLAAATHDITQSAASQVVIKLEELLGVQLINRSTRPLQVTQLGQLFYDGCKTLIEQFDELKAHIRNAQAELVTTIQVAAIYSVGLSDMGQYVERFQELLPNVKVQIEYLHPDRVQEKVLDGTADLGLVSFPRRTRDLAPLPWREEEMVLVCPPGHPLAALERVHLSQLDGEKFVGFAKGLTIRRYIDRYLRENDVNIVVAMEFDNIENIKKAIEIGAGVGLLPEPTLRREVQAGTLVARPLTGCRLVRPLGIIHRRHARLSSTAMRFVELLQETEARNGARRDGSHRGRNGTAHGPKKDRVP